MRSKPWDFHTSRHHCQTRRLPICQSRSVLHKFRHRRQCGVKRDKCEHHITGYANLMQHHSGKKPGSRRQSLHLYQNQHLQQLQGNSSCSSLQLSQQQLGQHHPMSFGLQQRRRQHEMMYQNCDFFTTIHDSSPEVQLPQQSTAVAGQQLQNPFRYAIARLNNFVQWSFGTAYHLFRPECYHIMKTRRFRSDF